MEVKPSSEEPSDRAGPSTLTRSLSSGSRSGGACGSAAARREKFRDYRKHRKQHLAKQQMSPLVNLSDLFATEKFRHNYGASGEGSRLLADGKDSAADLKNVNFRKKKEEKPPEEELPGLELSESSND